MSKSMYDLGKEYGYLREVADYGGHSVHPETGEVIDDLAGAWVDLEGEVDDKIAATAHVLRRLEADAAQLKAEELRLKERRSQIEVGRSRLKDLLRSFMVETGHHRVKTASVSVSLGKPSQHVVITDPDRLGPVYNRIKVEPARDRIKKSLLAGEEVTGAKLEDGPRRLTIK